MTITLDPTLLSKVDSFVDGQKIRNRSHAVEYLIKKSLPPTVNRAVILAGGKSVNFRPLTYEIPNVLIPFRGKPLLAHLIDQIKNIGIKEIVVCVGYLSERIVDEFGSGKDYGVNLIYSYDGDKQLGNAGALYKARKHLDKGPVLVMHGDILTNIDLNDLVEFHDGAKYAVTIALTTVDDPQKFGMVKVRGIDIVEFNEKPRGKDKVSNLIHAGVYILEQVAFKSFQKNTPSSMEKSVFPKLAKNNQLAGYVFEGQWFDISYPHYYEKALMEFEHG